MHAPALLVAVLATAGQESALPRLATVLVVLLALAVVVTGVQFGVALQRERSDREGRR